MRGCFFHYTDNLPKRKVKVQKATGREVDEHTLIVLTALPFLHGLNTYLRVFLARLRLRKSHLQVLLDAQLIAYVVRTHV